MQDMRHWASCRADFGGETMHFLARMSLTLLQAGRRMGELIGRYAALSHLQRRRHLNVQIKTVIQQIVALHPPPERKRRNCFRMLSALCCPSVPFVFLV